MADLNVEFVNSKTLAEAKADTTSGKIYFPTDDTSIVFQGKVYGGSSAYVPASLMFFDTNVFIKAPSGTILTTDHIQLGRYRSSKNKTDDIETGEVAGHTRKKDWRVYYTSTSCSSKGYTERFTFVRGAYDSAKGAYSISLPSNFIADLKECGKHHRKGVEVFRNVTYGIRVTRNDVPITDWMPFSINKDGALCRRV